MKIAALFVVLCVAGAAAPSLAAEGHAQHQPTGHHQLSLDHGRKWATDEPLRKGMTQIRTAMAGNLEAIHQEKMSAEHYHALGVTIQQQVTTIIAQCKLEPQADAMLHIVLTDLLEGANAMQGKGPLPPATGAHKVVEGINAYGDYFNHPGWRSLP